jgi:hypothetical protein
MASELPLVHYQQHDSPSPSKSVWYSGGGLVPVPLDA